MNDALTKLFEGRTALGQLVGVQTEAYSNILKVVAQFERQQRKLEAFASQISGLGKLPYDSAGFAMCIFVVSVTRKNLLIAIF